MLNGLTTSLPDSQGQSQAKSKTGKLSIHLSSRRSYLRSLPWISSTFLPFSYLAFVFLLSPSHYPQIHRRVLTSKHCLPENLQSEEAIGRWKYQFFGSETGLQSSFTHLLMECKSSHKFSHLSDHDGPSPWALQWWLEVSKSLAHI